MKMSDFIFFLYNVKTIKISFDKYVFKTWKNVNNSKKVHIKAVEKSDLNYAYMDRFDLHKESFWCFCPNNKKWQSLIELWNHCSWEGDMRNFLM